ncbi:MAG: carbohydrate porin, partial [Pirellulales bacterium]
LSEGDPLFTLTAFDPEERATSGLEDPYARGVVIVPDLSLRISPFGRPGVYNFGGTYSTAEYTSVDPSAWLRFPPQLTGMFPEESGSWCLYANFYQALWVDPEDESRSWGLFGQFGISDGNPNPIRFVTNGGIAGRSMIPGREGDRFGVGYFYLGLSDEFKAVTQAVLPQQDEYGVELFYNYAITPWCFLTGDVQFARPSTVGIDPPIIAGLRLQIVL